MALRKSVIMNRHRKSFTSRAQKQSQQYKSSTNTKLNVIIKQEDEVALLQEESPELTHAPFRTNAFKKVLDGLTNVGLFLNNKGAHVQVIHETLEKLGYTQTVTDITCFEEVTERSIKSFQEAYGLNNSGYFNAETLWAMNLMLEQLQKEEHTQKIKKVSYIMSPDLVELYYPELVSFIVRIDDKTLSAPLFKQPFEGTSISEENIGGYIYSTDPLYVVSKQENGWIEVRSSGGIKGYIPAQLTRPYSLLLDEVVITAKSNAYEALEQLIKKDTWYKNLDDDRAVSLIRVFTRADQNAFLDDSDLQDKIQRYLNVEQMARAMQGFDVLPIDKMDTILIDSQRFFKTGLPYYLYRNLLLKSKEGRERDRYYGKWFKADDSVSPKKLDLTYANKREERTEKYYLNNFRKNTKAHDVKFGRGQEYLYDQLFVEGLPDKGIAFTNEEINHMNLLLRHEQKQTTNVSDFVLEQAQKSYLNAFRRNALRIALEVIDVSERAIKQQYQSILDGEIAQLRNTFKKHENLYKRARHVDYSALLPNLSMSPKRGVAKLREKKRIAENVQNFREAVGKDFPIYLSPEIDIFEHYNKIVKEQDNSTVEEWLKEVLDEKIENIDETKINLLTDEDLLWKLEGLMGMVKQQLNPFQSQALDKIINEKTSAEHREDAIYAGALAVLGIGLAIVSFGSLSPVAAAIVGGASLLVGAIDTAIAYDEYTTFSAASNTAIDPTLELTNNSPWAGWVVLGIVGAGLDAISAVKIVNKLGVIDDLSPRRLIEKIDDATKSLNKTLKVKIPNIPRESLIRLANFRIGMSRWILKEGEMIAQGFTNSMHLLDDFMGRNVLSIMADGTLGGIPNPSQLTKWGEQFLEFTRNTKLAQRAGKLADIYQENSELIQVINQLAKQGDEGGDIGNAIKNLVKKLEGMQQKGKGLQVKAILERLQKIIKEDGIPGEFTDLLWAFSSADTRIKVSSTTILVALEKLSSLQSTGKISSEIITILGAKISKGQLGGDAVNWILRNYEHLDEDTLKLFNTRLSKNGINKYIMQMVNLDIPININSQLERLRKAGLKVIEGEKSISFFSKEGILVAEIKDGLLLFKYSGFGGDIVMNPEKATTVLGKFAEKWEDVTSGGTRNFLGSNLDPKVSGLPEGAFSRGNGKTVYNGDMNFLDIAEDEYNAILNKHIQKYIDKGLNKIEAKKLGLEDGNNEFWDKYNYPFLEDAFKRGDDIRLVSDPDIFKNSGTYARELNAINGKNGLAKKYGYVYNTQTKTYIKL